MLIRNGCFRKLLCFFIVASSSLAAGKTEKTLSPAQRAAVTQTAEESKATADYLYSFDNARLENGSKMVNYSSSAQASNYFSVEKLSDGSDSESDYEIRFDVNYMKFLDILYFDLSLYKSDELIRKESVYGFPFSNPDGSMNIRFDFHGTKVLLSDVEASKGEVEKDSLSSSFSSSLHITQGISTGSGLFYDVVSISSSVSSFDESLGLALKYVYIPTMLKDGPVNYLFYTVKLKLALKNYNHNSSLKLDKAFITKQETLSSWKFGLFSMSYSGCEIIAMYNMLYASGADPDLPSLIAMTELFNADILFGWLGTNPSDEFTNNLVISLMSFYDANISPLVSCAMKDLYESICNCIPDAPGWFRSVLKITAEITATAIDIQLKKLLLKLTSAVQLFIMYTVNTMKDYSDVLNPMISPHSLAKYDSVAEYDTAISNKRQGIITFWNETKTLSSGATIVDIEKQIHTVYIEKYYSKTYKAYRYITYNFNGRESSTVKGLISSFSAAEGEQKFISGIILEE